MLFHFGLVDCPRFVEEKTEPKAIKAVRAKIKCRRLGSGFVGLFCAPGSEAFALITVAFAGSALRSHQHRGANVADSPSSTDEIALFCRYRIVNAFSFGADYHKKVSGFLLNTSKATSLVNQSYDLLSRKLIAGSCERLGWESTSKV